MEDNKSLIKCNFMHDDVQFILRNVKKCFKIGDIEIKALDNINLTVQKGDFKMIQGPSGCGKTTLLNVLGGLDSPDSGECFINYGNKFKDINKFSKNELTNYRRKMIGVIFQFYNLIPILNALENVELAARFSLIKDPRKQSKKILDKFGLENKYYRYPNQLSGGEQQRVAIARALVKDPILILADEPTGNLDTKKSREIYKVLKILSEEYGKTVLVVTHDIEIANSFSNDHILIRDGKILHEEQEKENQEIMKKKMRDAYENV